MVKINPFDYFNNTNTENKLIENFSEIKEELENLEEVNELIDNFERNSFFHSEFFLKNSENQNLGLKIKIINFELKEKNEINERLHSLGYNLGLLRTLLVVKEDNIFKKIKESFLVNDYSSIPVIIKELNEFKDRINELENSYNALINEKYSSIDFKVRHEHHLEEHLKDLNNVHKKQKKLLMSMGLMFTSSFKNILKQENLKTK